MLAKYFSFMWDHACKALSATLTISSLQMKTLSLERWNNMLGANHQHTVWTQYLEPTSVCLTLDLGPQPPPGRSLQSGWAVLSMLTPIGTNLFLEHFPLSFLLCNASDQRLYSSRIPWLRTWHQTIALEVSSCHLLAVLSWTVYLN